MASSPNPVYNPKTGRLTYPDGEVVDPTSVPKPTTSSDEGFDQIVGNLGCCSRVISYFIPTAVIVDSFRTAASPLDALVDSRIRFMHRGNEVPRPPEFGVVQVMNAASVVVGRGLLPHSPYQSTHAAWLASEDGAAWLAANPDADGSLERSDVPTTTIGALRDWIRAVAGQEYERAKLALDVEEARTAGTRKGALSEIDSAMTEFADQAVEG